MGPLGSPQQGGRHLLLPEAPQGEGQPREALAVQGILGRCSGQLLERGAGLLPVRGLQVERVAQPAPPGVGVGSTGDGGQAACPRGVPRGQHPADKGPLIQGVHHLHHARCRGDAGTGVGWLQPIHVDSVLLEGRCIFAIGPDVVQVQGHVGVDRDKLLEHAAVLRPRLRLVALAGDRRDEILDLAAEGDCIL